jgi:hypothetical protein
MLNNKTNAQLIPDPWETPTPVEPAKPTSKTWQLPREIHLLMSTAENVATPKLLTVKPTSEQILLEDELKLKVTPGSLIKQQMEKALALIYWLGTINQFQISLN